MPRFELRQVFTDPTLLFLEDRGDLAVDQDGVRRGVDLALGVTELDDILILPGLHRDIGSR